MATSDIKKGPLYVDSTNNRVGIGTASPTELVDIAHSGSQVAGAVRIGDPSSISSNTGIYMRTTGLATIGAAGGTIVFDTNFGSSEKVRIDSDGLKFNGDTAQANALDDYEEGTWTPTFTAAISNPTVSYDQQLGYYQKIGNTVYFSVQLGTGSVSGGSGDLYISGFPFTSSSSKRSRSGAWGLNYTWNINVNPASWWMNQGANFLYLYFNNNSASNITTSHMGTGSGANRIWIQGFYTTDA